MEQTISYNRLYGLIIGFILGSFLGAFLFGASVGHAVTLFIAMGIYLKILELIERKPDLNIDEQIDAKLGTYTNPDESTYKEVVINKKHNLTTEG